MNFNLFGVTSIKMESGTTMTSVFVTGASGFVGKHVVAYLRAHTDWRVVTSAIPDYGCDYIINLASGSSVEKSIKEPVDFIKNNITCMLDILEYARNYPPKIFLHMSTVEVHSLNNPYAASKAAQEAVASAYHNTYGVPVIMATSHNIVGEGQSPDKFVPKITQLIKDGEPVNIYVQNSVVGKRVYNSVLNVASALLFMLKLPFSPLAHYDIGGGEELNNLEMAILIASILNKPLDYKTIEAESIRPGYTSQLVTTGIKLEPLGWKPPRTLEEGLAWIK